MSDQANPGDPVKLPEISAKLVELAEAMGVSNIRALPGAWEVTIDEHWRVAVNAHDTDVQVAFAEGMSSDGVAVTPFCCYVEYNGWTAACFNFVSGEGELCAGAMANEDALIAAIDRRIEMERA